MMKEHKEFSFLANLGSLVPDTKHKSLNAFVKHNVCNVLPPDRGLKALETDGLISQV